MSETLSELRVDISGSSVSFEASTSKIEAMFKPMESGSGWYAEEVMRGKVFKLKGTIAEVIPNKKIVFRYSFPISLVAPKFEWLIDPKGSTTVFTAIGYLRAGRLFYKIARREMEWKVAMHMKHVKEEGENLKRILENKPP